MKTIAQVVAAIEECQTSSEQRWETAIETDDSHRGFAEDAEACDASYEAAIETLNDAYDGYLANARGHLEDARRLELSAGDDQDARRALAALAEIEVREAE